MAIGYVCYMWITTLKKCSNYLETFDESVADFMENALSWIPQIGVWPCCIRFHAILVPVIMGACCIMDNTLAVTSFRVMAMPLGSLNMGWSMEHHEVWPLFWHVQKQVFYLSYVKETLPFFVSNPSLCRHNCSEIVERPYNQ